MSSPLKQNTTTIQELLNTINALPDAGGVDLPTLTNEGTAADLLSGKELIDGDGNVVAGTFSIEEELTTQDNLISQIQTALQNKASASEPVLQTKTVTPTTSQQVIIPDSGYDGLSNVTVNAMPTATQATPSVTVNSSGLITATATQTAGYVAAGSKSGTKQLTTQAAKTITPSTSSQTAVAKNVYTTGAVTVGAIPSTYVKPTATKAATTYTPTTSNQTIVAGTYCSGAQTIKGDSNLVAGNIKSGVSIFGVNGSYEGSGGGSSGGGSVETCTVSFSVPDDVIIGLTLYYQETTGTYSFDASTLLQLFGNPVSIVLKNSLIAIHCPNGFKAYSVDGNALTPQYSFAISGNLIPIHITGDCTITITDS